MNKNHKTYKIRPVRPKKSCLHLKVAKSQKVLIWSHLKKDLRNHCKLPFQSTVKSWHDAVILLIDLKVGPNWKYLLSFSLTFILKFRDGNTTINDMVVFSTKQNLLFSSQRHLNFKTMQVFLWFMKFDKTVNVFVFFKFYESHKNR